MERPRLRIGNKVKQMLMLGLINYASCCTEIDIWGANSISTAVTALRLASGEQIVSALFSPCTHAPPRAKHDVKAFEDGDGIVMGNFCCTPVGFLVPSVQFHMQVASRWIAALLVTRRPGARMSRMRCGACS